MNRSRALQRISVSSLRLSALGLLAATPLGALELRCGVSPRAPLPLALDTFAREGDALALAAGSPGGSPGNSSPTGIVPSQESDRIATVRADPARDSSSLGTSLPLLLARGPDPENGVQEPLYFSFGWEGALLNPGQPSSPVRNRPGVSGGTGSAFVATVAESEIAAAVAAAARESGTFAIVHPAVPPWSVERGEAKVPPAAASNAGTGNVALLPGDAVLPESSAPTRTSEVAAGGGRIFFLGTPSASSLWNSGNGSETFAKSAFSLNAVVSLTLSLPTGEFVPWTGMRGELGGNDQSPLGASVGTTLGKAGRSIPGAVADVISPIGYSFNDIALGQPTGRRSAADLLGQFSRFDSSTALGGQAGEGRLEVRATGAGVSNSSISTARFEPGSSLAGGDGGRLEAGQAVFGRTDRGSVQASNGSSGRQLTSVTVDAPPRPPSFLVGHLLPRPAVSRSDADVVRPSTSSGSFTLDRNQQHETVLGVVPGEAGESEVNALTLDGSTSTQHSEGFLPSGNAFRFLLGGGAMVGSVFAAAAEAEVFGPPSVDSAGNAQFPVLSSPVPEPATWLLFAVSLGILAAALRFRRI